MSLIESILMRFGYIKLNRYQQALFALGSGAVLSQAASTAALLPPLGPPSSLAPGSCQASSRDLAAPEAERVSEPATAAAPPVAPSIPTAPADSVAAAAVLPRAPTTELADSDLLMDDLEDTAVRASDGQKTAVLIEVAEPAARQDCRALEEAAPPALEEAAPPATEQSGDLEDDEQEWEWRMAIARARARDAELAYCA